jgi:hypothetical protein
MPESAEEVYARVVAAVGESGRLPMPPVEEWGDWFPWEVVDGNLQPKVLKPPVAAEPARSGLDGADCQTCTGGGGNVRIWENWNFHLLRPALPKGLPLVLWLNTNEHLDFTDLDDEKAAEMGRISVWLTRIMSHLENIGRVHACRWGDGSEHMHTWFIARTARLPQVIGSMAIEWNQILPPSPEDVWLEDAATVARKLALHDGRALV